MELSERLNSIVKNLEKNKVLADIGTDHGYIPIYAIRNNISDSCIAGDINKEPLAKAKLNSILEGITDGIDFRLGGGLSILKKDEVDVTIIAGMGGNLIRDILEADIEKVGKMDYLILQPAQNPEVLREYLYNSDYEIINEDLCFDAQKYYEVFKVRRKENEITKLDDIYYEISPKLLSKKHPLMKSYLDFKIENYNKILNFINEDSTSSKKRKEEIEEKISLISNMISFL